MAGGSRTSSHACSAPVFDTSNEKGISNFCRSSRVQFVKLNERCAVSVVSSTAGLKYPTTGWAKLSVLANSSRHRTSRPYRFSLRQNEAWLTADGTHTHGHRGSNEHPTLNTHLGGCFLVQCCVREGRNEDGAGGGHHETAGLQEPIACRDVALEHALVHKHEPNGL